MSANAWLPLAFVLGYLLGSIPFGLILTRLAGTEDLRSIGSGNIGATNVLRTGRKGLAAATLLSTRSRARLPSSSPAISPVPEAAMLAGLGAFLGHLFPVWLKFKGGKGVAVYIGILIGLFWPAAVLFCALWLVTAVISRYSSLSALVASFVTPIFLWWFGHPALAALFALLTCCCSTCTAPISAACSRAPKARSGRNNHYDRSARSMKRAAAIALASSP